ncbi:MAG TPA: hypothetical protein VEA36_01895 [Candidatus Paceibacterota bacterium]|nr:hypothetical protein [Candidatus Paceibacterota bacterium]
MDKNPFDFLPPRNYWAEHLQHLGGRLSAAQSLMDDVINSFDELEDAFRRELERRDQKADSGPFEALKQAGESRLR